MTERQVTGGSRALVLGGGGPVGVAWEIGLAAGMAAAGVHLSEADSVVGTSAGSITGAKLTGGHDVTDLHGSVETMFKNAVSGSGADEMPQDGLGQLVQLMLQPSDEERSPEEQRTAMGRLAVAAKTISEDAFVGSMQAEFGDEAWPERFSCTAVDVETGEFKVWNKEADVPLDRAVASSCSVPGIYPPITIDGRRYMDGGTRSALNADLAEGHEAAVVISCMLLEIPPFLDDPNITAFFDREKAGIESLRQSGANVEVIAPDEEFLMISGMGMFLMDFTRIQDAADAGMRLGRQVAERIATIW